MRIRDQDYNDITVIQYQGELDGDGAEPVKNMVIETVAKRRRGIVLDLNEAGFIDSQGLELLLWVRDYCKQNKVQLRLAGLDENAEKILEVTRLDDEFIRHAELAEAVRSFA